MTIERLYSFPSPEDVATVNDRYTNTTHRIAALILSYDLKITASRPKSQTFEQLFESMFYEPEDLEKLLSIDKLATIDDKKHLITKLMKEKQQRLYEEVYFGKGEKIPRMFQSNPERKERYRLARAFELRAVELWLHRNSKHYESEY